MINQKLGPYRVLERIGEGGMGAVYRAVDEMLGRDVAIKVLRPALAHDEGLVERFRQEARSLARIAHPNVAALYGLFQEQDTLFMAMEFVPGETADALIRRRGRLPWKDACALVADVLAGLDAAHRLGVIHRDLKPANLLLAPSGAVKITDFGIARVLGTARSTRTGAVVGTLAYMAPEQVRGEEGDARSDIYTAGMVLYELLTGDVAFRRTSEYDLMRAVVEEPARRPREALTDAPEWLDALVMKALEKNPADRYQSAAEMLSAIAGQLPAADRTTDPAATRVVPAGGFVAPTRVAIEAPAPTVATSAPRRFGNRRIPLAAGAVLVIGLTAGWAAWRPGPQPPTPPVKQAAAMTPVRELEPIRAADVPVVPPEAPPAPPEEPVRRPRRTVPPAAVPPTENDLPAPTPPPTAPPVVAPPARTVTPRLPDTTGPAAAAPEPPAAPDVVFGNVKLLQSHGEKTQEIEVVLTFSRHQLLVTAKKGEAPAQAMAYRRVSSAVYSQSKHPRWKEGSAAALAVGVFAAPVFFMKGTKHWLTIEGAGEALVLRLDKSNYQLILPEVEVRTGRRVERFRNP